DWAVPHGGPAAALCSTAAAARRQRVAVGRRAGGSVRPIARLDGASAAGDSAGGVPHWPSGDWEDDCDRCLYGTGGPRAQAVAGAGEVHWPLRRRGSLPASVRGSCAAPPRAGPRGGGGDAYTLCPTLD